MLTGDLLEPLTARQLLLDPIWVIEASNDLHHEAYVSALRELPDLADRGRKAVKQLLHLVTDVTNRGCLELPGIPKPV